MISISAWWNIQENVTAHQNTNLKTARSSFELVLTTRVWNASMGGVYGSVSEDAHPNPFLEVPHRDLQVEGISKLTLINPAYMTRMIAEYAEDGNNVQFHITSLNPIRPANKAYEWEIPILETFDLNQTAEYSCWDRNTDTYYYLASLLTEESCLKCHENQGYQVGDVRGGISVTFDSPYPSVWPVLSGHILIAIMGVGLIPWFGDQLVNTYRDLEVKPRRMF